MSMKILLIDGDLTNFRNLVLMKISAWHKKQGDRVFLNDGCKPDKVYISCVLSKNAGQTKGIVKFYSCPIETGGSGIDLKKELPYEIEHIMPDYDLYDIDYSMGFTSRGCIRKCPWCIVPEKEGWIRNHAPIEEFLHPDHNKLGLYDNNFLASPRWRENLQFIIDHRLKVDFNQGNDIRLINEENAKMLAETDYRAMPNFDYATLRFSFDSPQIEPQVRRGIQTILDAGVKRRHVRFYTMVGYNTSLEQDFHRVEIIKEFGLDPPFIMKYNGRRDIEFLNHLARWCDNPWFYKTTSFLEYDAGNSKQLIRGYLSNHPNSALGRI